MAANVSDFRSLRSKKKAAGEDRCLEFPVIRGGDLSLLAAGQQQYFRVRPRKNFDWNSGDNRLEFRQKNWAAKGEETRCPKFPNRGGDLNRGKLPRGDWAAVCGLKRPGYRQS